MITISTSRSLCVFIIIACTIGFFGCKSMARARHNANVPAEQIQRLKDKTVVLVLPENEYPHFDDYVANIPKAWTITPVKVVKFQDVFDYFGNADKYAFFAIDGEEVTRTSNTMTYSNTHYYLSLQLAKSTVKNWKEKVTVDNLSRVELYPDFKTTNRKFKKDMIDDVYTKSTYRNFKLPYVMAYMRFVQKNISGNKNPWVYENYTDETLKARLGRDTLYVPDSLMYDRNKWNGKEELKDKGFFKSYGGPYKYVSDAELINLVKTRSADKPLFLFEYILSSTDKYVGVLEVTSGTIVYRRYTPVTYNIKSKDLSGILK